MFMLVLARRPGEQIVIAGTIRLTVISVKGNQVRLGIAAPPDIPVDRKEIHDCRADLVSAGGLALGESLRER
jgi:carbon storage regulator